MKKNDQNYNYGFSFSFSYNVFYKRKCFNFLVDNSSFKNRQKKILFQRSSQNTYSTFVKEIWTNKRTHL